MLQSRVLAIAVAAASAATLLGSPGSAAAAELSTEELVKILRTIDERQSNSGDYKAAAFIEQKERGKDDLLYDAVIYRRDDDDKLIIIFQKPKSEAGKGYLRLDKNLFFYDPTVGKWERRTERERIGGTNSQRSDFDESRLAEEYTPKLVGEEKLGKFAVYHLELTAKPNADVAYPVMHLWIDQQSTNVLKAQEYALSGRLMRTTYYPKWNTMFSEDKKADVYFPAEIRIFDEVEKGNSTLVVLRDVELKPLQENIFTKAWLERQSR